MILWWTPLLFVGDIIVFFVVANILERLHRKGKLGNWLLFLGIVITNMLSLALGMILGMILGATEIERDSRWQI